MSRRAAWLIASIALVGCGPKQPAAAPAYTPVNSPEPATACPELRDAAKRAREDLLELGSSEARVAAAAAVFAHAECERRQFDAMGVDAPTQDALVERLRAARGRYQDVRNLYEEVGRYQALRWAIGAGSRLGELCDAFAEKLRRVAVPGEIRDPDERTAFLAEIGEYAAIYDHEALIAHAGALRAADGAISLVRSDTDVRTWVETSCLALSYLDATTHRSLELCRLVR
jgi:hypothetical protein